ncbi:hypothetical protein CJU89_5385 [Yarrowia sp. B02]|nr:hypothetical protein CJU89_5385 [Yarrowia sp. B02]
MSENNDGPPDPARDAVAQLLRSALRRNMDVQHNREVVQEYMDRLLNGEGTPNTEPAPGDAPREAPEAPAATERAPATPPQLPQPPPHRNMPRERPIMLVTYSLGTTQAPPPGTADNTIWSLATEASRQAREARGREARGRAEAGSQAYRSRSQSQRRGGDRRRERSPMRTRVSDGGPEAARATAEAAAAPPEPEEPGHVHLNQGGGWLSNPLIQRLLQGRATEEEGGEAAAQAQGAGQNITFSPGGIDHRPDGTTTATFTIPTHMFAGGVLGGGRHKPKASRRVIRNLETLELSEVTEQNCPICYDAFEDKPLGWDAIVAKLAEQERKQEEGRQEEGRQEVPASENVERRGSESAATTTADSTFDFSQVNPATSVHGPVLIEQASASERAIQAEADEILRARRNPSVEENVRRALDEAESQTRYIVDTPEDAAAFREANPQQLCPIIRVDPEAGPRQPFVIPRIPEGLREAHEEVALHRVHQRAMNRAVTRHFQREINEGGNLRAAATAAAAAATASTAPAGTAPADTTGTTGTTEQAAPSTAGSNTTGTAETGGETGADAEANSADSESEANFPESHVATKMPCGHIFGHLCICEWLRSNNSCPLCRVTVESESEYLQSTGQADESHSGGFFEVLFNVLPRVFQEIEADRRRHNNNNQQQTPAAAAEGGDLASELLGGAATAATAATASAAAGTPPVVMPQENLPHFLSRGVDGWPQLLHAHRVETGTGRPQTLPPVADAIREFRNTAHRAATQVLDSLGAGGAGGAGGAAEGAGGAGAGAGAGASAAARAGPAAEGTGPHAHAHVHQPVPGIYVYHRPSDFFRLHGGAEANRVSTAGPGNVGAAGSASGSVGQETLQAVGTDGGDSAGGSSGSNGASGPSGGEGLRSRLMEPIMRRIFRSRENDRHHPYRRAPPGSGSGGSGSGSSN